MNKHTFPRHDGGLILEHNPHLAFHQTIEGWENQLAICLNVDDKPDYQLLVGWISLEQRRLALAANSLWVLQWYPRTPISFHRLLACDLEPLLNKAREIDQESPHEEPVP
jgi:hypothetical protein